MAGQTQASQLVDPALIAQILSAQKYLADQERVATEKSGALFKSVFLPHYETEPSPPFHYELLGLALKEGHWASEWQGKEGLAVAAPRGSAKSTILSLTVPMYWGLHRKKKFVILVSNTDSQAEFLADSLRREFEDNERVEEVFGAVRGDRFKDRPLKWTNQDFTIAITDPPGSTNAADIKWTTRYVAKGMLSKIRGLRTRAARPDALVLDDAENDLHVMTDEQRAKTWDWLYKALIPMLDPKNATVLIGGTLLHFDSMLAKVLKMQKPNGESVYVTRLWKIYNDDGTVLWPERFTKEWVDNKRVTMSARAFSSEFMNDPRDPETAKFRPEWFQWYQAGIDTDVRDGVLYFRGMPLRIYAGVDQAIEEKEDKAIDETAIVVLGITPDNRLVVIHTWHARVDFPTQVKTIRNIAAQFNVHISAVEKAAYQLALKQQLIAEGYSSVFGLDNTAPKYERITAMSQHFEDSMVYLRACGPDETGSFDELKQVRIHPSQEQLYTDLIRFPSAAHDDLPDALNNAIVIAGRVRGFEEKR